jgi:acyl carrier protein phosphodiesterase
MNFLAHAYLSFDNDEILVGNVIGDFVKGKPKENLPQGIRKGIELHRFIDTVTDSHPAFFKAGKMFKPAVGLYSGAFVDIVFDYFLANDTHKNEQEWKLFSQRVYQTLEKQKQFFPNTFAGIFPHMQHYDWLYQYRFLKSIEDSFRSLTRRAKYLADTDKVTHIFEENIPQLEAC